MIPIDFEGSNITLNKPDNMTDEQCLSIKAYKGLNNDGFPCFITCWKPSEEELEQLKQGYCVWLSVLSNSFAPASIYVSVPMPKQPQQVA